MYSDIKYCSNVGNGNFVCTTYCSNTTLYLNHCLCTSKPYNVKYALENMFNLADDTHNHDTTKMKLIKENLKNCFNHKKFDKIEKIVCLFFKNDNNQTNPLGICGEFENENKYKLINNIFTKDLLIPYHFPQSNSLSSIFSNNENDGILPITMWILIIIICLGILFGVFIYKKFIKNYKNKTRSYASYNASKGVIISK